MDLIGSAGKTSVMVADGVRGSGPARFPSPQGTHLCLASPHPTRRRAVFQRSAIVNLTAPATPRHSPTPWHVNSSNARGDGMLRELLDRQGIGRIEYDQASLLLRVHFRKGSVYEYVGVPRSVFDWLVRTPQPAAYLQRMITPRFDYRRVDGASPPDPEALEQQLKASLERLKPHE